MKESVFDRVPIYVINKGEIGLEGSYVQRASSKPILASRPESAADERQERVRQVMNSLGIKYIFIINIINRMSSFQKVNSVALS